MSQSGLKLPKTSEAEIRALALAKVKAQKVYNEVWLRDTRDYTDEQLVDHELEVNAAMKVLFAAGRALSEAQS